MGKCIAIIKLDDECAGRGNGKRPRSSGVFWPEWLTSFPTIFFRVAAAAATAARAASTWTGTTAPAARDTPALTIKRAGDGWERVVGLRWFWMDWKSWKTAVAA